MPPLFKSPTTLGIYGKSSMGKTFQLVEIVKYLRRRWNWKPMPDAPPPIRLGSWDSTLDPFRPFIDEGFIDAIPLTSIKDGDGNVVIAQVLNAIGWGQWPTLVRKADPEKGIEPLWIWRGRAGPPPPSFRIKEIPNEVWPSGLPQDNGVRAYLFEGISEMAFQLLNEHGVKGRGVKEEKQDKMGRYASERLTDSDLIKGLDSDLRSGSPTQSHYGDVTLQVLVNFLKQGIFTLPVDLVVITMHEDKGVNEVTGTTALGPAMPGQKAISQVTQKASHFVHLTTELASSGELKYWAHTLPHKGEGTLSMQEWPAKVTMSADQTKRFNTKYKGGKIPLTLEPVGSSGTVADILEFIWPAPAVPVMGNTGK